MVEVYTIGGGEYIVNVFNAVAAWTGGGGYKGLIQVVMILGLIYSLLVVAFTLNVRAWLNWFIGSTAIYLCLMVPTVDVKVTDRINPSLAPATVANVPLGLGVIASFTSQVGDWLTRTAETVFTMPSQLSYSTNGMIYGARLFDQTRNFQIRDAEFATNLQAYLKNCTFGDILLHQKSLTDLAASKDLWTDLGPGSQARAQPWVQRDGSGVSSSIVVCRNAYSMLSGQWSSMIEANTPFWAKATYPKLSTAEAVAKLKQDLPIANTAFTSASSEYVTTMRQNTAINAFMQARDAMAGSDGQAAIDTFATTRADIQSRNTYNSIAQQAMSWVPILNVVLTVVFYAMFPVIFPLFLMPQTGPGALKGYIAGFFYLASWGPLYVILHMICMSRATAAAQGVASGGVTLGTFAGIGAVNAETATIAGFMLMSVPFIAGGLAKGALSISGQATSILAPAQNAAEAAAVEQTTGNYSYGNTSFANSTSNMRQSSQWSDAPIMTTGFGGLTQYQDNGAAVSNFGNGHNVFDTSRAISNIPFNATMSQGAIATESRQAAVAARLADGFEEASRREVSNLNALRASHGFSSEASHGSDSSAGTRGGSNTEQTDRTGIAETRGLFDRSSVSDGTRHAVDGGKTSNWSGQFTGSVHAGAGVDGRIGLGGGKLPGVGVGGKAGADVGYNQSLTHSDVTSDQRTRSQSGDQSMSSSNDIHRDHSNGTATSISDGTYHQDGAFARNQSSESHSRAVEQSQSRIASYNEQARHYRELSRSLEQHASFAESHGFSLSTDLRQDLARWYENEERSKPGANLPALWQTDVSQTQEMARNVAIGRWASERQSGIERDIQSALADPALAGLQIPLVEHQALGGVKRPAVGGEAATSVPAVSRPDDGPARQLVEAGAAALSGELRDHAHRTRDALRRAPKGPNDQ
ncbi:MULTISPECIES: conjugal transfer protein TraG N-terminal domain-containing protein [unclassified Sphingomonas]|uniref:conjugal transfer protein TraG N-terminal domain-containing protein n=1 Tax=unclassified Sphingomonas TaxID=196159 RepID=UPI00226A7E04|nr:MULTISPECIES: conjugal transfer protein TraG N-terminal domain-containing protein [unclassified Sphingomonas]